MGISSSWVHSSRRSLTFKFIMKTAIVFLCALAMAHSYTYYNDYYRTYRPVVYGGNFNPVYQPIVQRTVSQQCFPQRIAACQNFYGSYGVPVSAFDCEGQCGLCDLCAAATEDVPECSTLCAKGKDACMDTCEAGKAACTACGIF